MNRCCHNGILPLNGLVVKDLACVILFDDWLKKVAKAANEYMNGKEYKFYPKPMAHFKGVAWIIDEIEERKKKKEGGR